MACSRRSSTALWGLFPNALIVHVWSFVFLFSLYSSSPHHRCSFGRRTDLDTALLGLFSTHFPSSFFCLFVPNNGGMFFLTQTFFSVFNLFDPGFNTTTNGTNRSASWMMYGPTPDFSTKSIVCGRQSDGRESSGKTNSLGQRRNACSFFWTKQWTCLLTFPSLSCFDFSWFSLRWHPIMMCVCNYRFLSVLFIVYKKLYFMLMSTPDTLLPFLFS